MTDIRVFRPRTWFAAICLSLVTFPAATAFGHGVRVFATVEKGKIVGQVYFTGGGKAKNVTVKAFLRADGADSADGAACREATTDDGGNFVFTSPDPGEYRLVAELHATHIAIFVEQTACFGRPVDGVSIFIDVVPKLEGHFAVAHVKVMNPALARHLDHVDVLAWAKVFRYVPVEFKVIPLGVQHALIAHET